MADLHDTYDPDRELEPEGAQLRTVLEMATEPPSEGPATPGDDAELAAVLERQRRVAFALSSAGPATPSHLGARIDALQRREKRAFGISMPTSWRPRWVAVAGAAATAVAAAAVVLVTAESSSGTLAATRVADVWQSPITSTALHPSQGNPSELNVSFHGTAYPAYRDSEGWHAVGTRTDQIAGKPSFTVFYGTGNRRAAYTVVPGSVSIPSSASRFVSGGVPMAEFRSGNRWIIVFRNHGNTCVLTAAAPREKAWLVKLAAWGSNGAPSTV
jgi:hypothetical protein